VFAITLQTITAQNDGLLVGISESKSLEKMNYKTKTFKKIADNIPNPDGIETLNKNLLLVTSWDDTIYLIDKQGTKTTLLDTKAEKNAL